MAAIVQMPAASSVTFVPPNEQIAGVWVANETASPEVDVAAIFSVLVASV